MSYTSLGTKEWCSNPEINVSMSYDRQRSGAAMQYKYKVVVSALSNPHYYEYPIKMKVYLDGDQVGSAITLKSNGTRTWSAIIKESGWITVNNKISGTVPISFNIYSGEGNNRDHTYSYNLTVDPALSVLAADDGVLGTSQFLAVTQQNANYTHTISYACGEAGTVICNKSSDLLIPWVPPLSLAAQNLKGNIVGIQFTITTYAGNTALGNKIKTITCVIPNDQVPVVTQSITDTTGLFGVYGAYVQNQSILNIALNITNSHGATTNKVTTTLDNKTYDGESITADKISNYGAMAIDTIVKDSRGREASTYTNINVLQYFLPQITTMKAKRCNQAGNYESSGDYLKINFMATIASLNDQNSANYSIKYKKSSDASEDFITVNLSSADVTNGYKIIAAEAGTYDIILSVTDEISSSQRAIKATSTLKFFSWLNQGTGFALNKIAELVGYFDINFDVIFRQKVWMNNYSDDQLSFFFQNDASRQNKTYENDSLYPHKVMIHGDGADSQYAFGISDLQNSYKHLMLYNDVEGKIQTDIIWKKQAINVTSPLSQLTISSQNTAYQIPFTSYIWCSNPSLLTLNDNAVVCELTGIIKLSAKIYLKSGFVDGDIVYIRIYVNGTQNSGYVYRVNGTGEQMINVVDDVIRVNSNDAVTIAVENRSGARGVVNTTYNNYLNYMYIEYVG